MNTAFVSVGSAAITGHACAGWNRRCFARSTSFIIAASRSGPGPGARMVAEPERRRPRSRRTRPKPWSPGSAAGRKDERRPGAAVRGRPAVAPLALPLLAGPVWAPVHAPSCRGAAIATPAAAGVGRPESSARERRAPIINEKKARLHAPAGRSPPAAGSPIGGRLRPSDTMSATIPIADPSLPPDATPDHAPSPDEAAALLRSCFEAFSARLLDGARDALELASDLFESTTVVPEVDVDAFRAQRAEWLERFARAIAGSFERWQKGTRRRGRRPDGDASAATLAVMTPFDQEKQAALVEATAFLRRFTRREIAALDARLAVLRPGPAREQDNPFGPDYILDALGATSRGVYPKPRVWRPLMVRLLTDLTPAINKIYISLNRSLADRGVLPDMKAALRARSEWRPADDRDLLPTFSKMLAE